MKTVTTLIARYIFSASIVIILFALVPLSHAQTADFLFMDLEASREELKQIIEKAGAKVVSVVAYDDTGSEIARGSGALIDDDGKIMTNAHVIKDAYSAEVISSSGRYERVSVVSNNEELDLAVIKIQESGEPPIIFDREYTVKPGERVFIIGKNRSLKDTFSEGTVDSVNRHDNSFEYIKINKSVSILAYPDSKDGVLFNTSGHMIGVTRSLISDHPLFDQPISSSSNEFYHALPSDVINTFLSEDGEIMHLKPAQSRIFLSWLRKQVTSFAIAAFITLYMTGFQKILMILLALVALISLVQWAFIKLKKIRT